ncbi:hypothetical protein KAR91_64495 [Candidatus Pacearchaeota archaeon]|nr:hypothetical protein [Candidatus Pacearchaeota archaeon]
MKKISLILLLSTAFVWSFSTFVLADSYNAGIIGTANGIDEHEGLDSCKVTVNIGTDSKIDIGTPCNIRIGGPRYSFTNLTAIDPELGAGENSKFIGITMNGYTTSDSGWTTTQKITVVPLARLNTPYGVSGPGSTISLIRDDRYFSTNRNHYDRIVWEKVVGARYVTGGEIYESSNLVLGQYAGTLFDAQTKEQSLSAFTTMSAVFLHLSSNEINWIGNKAPLVVDAVNYNPAGSSLVPMQNDNTFTIHTILKSPKGADGVPEGGWFFMYGDTEYATQADALAAITAHTAIRWGLFVNQATSGLVPVVLIIQQKNAAAVDTISDKRPCFVCRP